MATLARGNFSLNLGIVTLGAELSDEDRQCSWELYTELVTRISVVGKKDDEECQAFEGELYIESLSSLYRFFQEARLIMRKFPVGKIEQNEQDHLGVMLSRIMSDVLRPFLEKWQVDFRHWWEFESDQSVPPMERQASYPRLEEFLADWSSVRWLMKRLSTELRDVYQLVQA